MDDLLARGDPAPLRQVGDNLVGGISRPEPVEPAVLRIEPASLVDRRQHREAERPAELEILLAAARRDMDDAGAFLQRDAVPGDDLVLDLRGGRQMVEGALVPQPEQLLPAGHPHRSRVRKALAGDPFIPLAQDVFGLGVDRGRHVGGKRPWGGGPDHQ